MDELNNQLQRFDVIILDTDLLDVDKPGSARKVLSLIPNEKVVITTGYNDHPLTREAESLGIKNERILLKPFRLSKLWSAVMDS